jgi:hypothetical protein
MGSKLSQCFGLQSYVRRTSYTVQVQEKYETHPGQNHTDGVLTAVAFTLDEEYDENPESIFYQGTEV